MKRFLVVGLGNFGAGVASGLRRLGHPVVALDVDAEKVEAMAGMLGDVVIGDGTDPEVLERVGAGEVDAAVVSTGDDVAASLLVAVGLRDCGVEEIYVKVVSDLQARILEKLGVEQTVFPEHESALRLARRASNAAIVDYVDLGPGLSAQEMTVPDAWAGRSLRDLALPRNYNVTVIAVRNYLKDETEPIPDPDAPLTGSETLLLAGRADDLERVSKVE
jgi:trk system potassium uptake protein TrkA